MPETVNAIDIQTYKQQGNYKPFPTEPAAKPDHECTIAPNIVPAYPGKAMVGTSKYALKVTCKVCAWEVLAVDQVSAEEWARSHRALKNGQ